MVGDIPRYTWYLCLVCTISSPISPPSDTILVVLEEREIEDDMVTVLIPPVLRKVHNFNSREADAELMVTLGGLQTKVPCMQISQVLYAVYILLKYLVTWWRFNRHELAAETADQMGSEGEARVGRQVEVVYS